MTEFGPIQMKAVRQEMVVMGWARTYINRQLGRITAPGDLTAGAADPNSVPLAWNASTGSNLAGYECRGTFSLDGRRYSEVIPGNMFRRPGTTVAAVTVTGDAALVTTAASLETEHASAGVFVLPTMLLVVLLVGVAAVVLRRRRLTRSVSLS